MDEGIVEAFCVVWLLREDCGCQLTRVFHLYVWLKVLDRCDIWVFL